MSVLHQPQGRIPSVLFFTPTAIGVTTGVPAPHQLGHVRALRRGVGNPDVARTVDRNAVRSVQATRRIIRRRRDRRTRVGKLGNGVPLGIRHPNIAGAVNDEPVGLVQTAARISGS